MLTCNQFYEITTSYTYPYVVSCYPIPNSPPFSCCEVIDKPLTQCRVCHAYDNTYNLRINNEYVCCICGTINFCSCSVKKTNT
ncbi:hypothetical protein QTN25_007681 [Entamoeba marina]